MSNLTLYGIPNCDTVKRARKALDAAGVDHSFHDFRKDGLNAEQVARWADAVGLDTLINRRGMTWRKLDDADKAAIEGGDHAAIASQPTVIKRPVFDTGDSVLVGFAKGDEDAVIDQLQP